MPKPNQLRIYSWLLIVLISNGEMRHVNPDEDKTNSINPILMDGPRGVEARPHGGAQICQRRKRQREGSDNGRTMGRRQRPLTATG